MDESENVLSVISYDIDRTILRSHLDIGDMNN